MASKNDLSTFKSGASSVSVLQQSPKQIGRPKAEEKRDFKVTLSFTQKEGELLQQQAGLVPLATYLMMKLQETDVLREGE